MGVGDYCLVVYWLVAFAFMAIQWRENSRVFYVFGPPSVFWTGVTWPLWAAGVLGLLAYVGFCKARRALVPAAADELKQAGEAEPRPNPSPTQSEAVEPNGEDTP